MKSTLLAAVCVVALCLPGPASAAPADYFDLEPETLLNAQVTSAAKRLENVFQSPNAIYVISHEDIVNAGVTNIPDALRMAPGVNVAQTDGNSWAISIRGLNSAISNKLLVLVDGRSVYNPAFAGVFWEIVDMPLEDIERIEVIRGPGATVWGANAVNDVINIITKRAGDTQGSLVQAMGGTREQGLESLRYGGELANGGHYRVWGRGMNQSPSDAPLGGEANDEIYRLKAGFRADWENLMVQADAHHVVAHQFERVPNFTAPAFGTTFDTAFKYDGASLLGRWKTDITGGQLGIQSYVDFVSRTGSQSIDDRHFTYDFEAQYDMYARGRHEWTIGGGYRLVTRNESNTPISSVTPATQIDNLFSLFAQDKITLGEKFFLTLGTKIEHNDYSGLELQPSARLQWLPDDSQTVWAAVSRAVRTPTLLEQDITTIALNTPGQQFAIVSNEDFDSEALVAFELGYRRRLLPNLSVDTTAFLNSYSNLGVFRALTPFVVNNGIDPPFTFNPFEFANAAKAQTAGVEIATEWQARSNLDIKASYSYLDVKAQADTNVANQEAAEGLAPHHQVNLAANWRINDALSLNSTVAHVSQLRESNVDAYTRVDLNLGYQVSPGLRLNLVGQNLLEDEHREFGAITDRNAASIPRSVFGRITCKF